MTKSVPQVSKYMTYIPQTIGTDQSLETAEKMMRSLRIRHLPVLSSGKLAGVVSERDLTLYRALVADEEAKNATLEDVYQQEVYTVAPGAHLDEVVGTMAEKKLGSAVVVDNNKVVGIFTAVDAMSAFAEMLHTRLKP